MVDYNSIVNKATMSQEVFNRNRFECPSTWKGTFNSGFLIPVFVEPFLPGDTWSLDTTFFCRLSTQVLPPMDNIYLDFHIWSCYDRLRWDNFKKFMGERANPTDSISYLEPQINSGNSGFGYETPFDYCGDVPGVANLNVNANIYRIMNLIWNNFYRSELLQDSLPVYTDDGPDPLTQTDGSQTYPLLPRNKRLDYFTACCPNPTSVSGLSVTLPLGSTAPVSAGMYAHSIPNESLCWGYSDGSTMASNQHNVALDNPNARGFSRTCHLTANASGLSTKGIAPVNLWCDLTSATSATINTIRQAFATQQFLEREMLNGSRYVEQVYSFFGTLPPHSQYLPEFLGGATVMINTNVVPQTSSTDSTTPQGNLTAYGTASGTRIGFTHSFEEHGWVIMFVSARTDQTYQQGVDRKHTKRTRYDYYWPTFAHLGMQSVLNKEIYAQGASVVDTDGNIIDDKVFGYIPRYDEYRFKNSLITGRFRSSYSQSLDAYHYSQYFSQLPQLNDEFIKVPTGNDSPIKRTLAVQTEPEFLLDCFHDLVKISTVSIDGHPGLTRL